MRIIGGAARGRKLKSPKGRGVRPTLGKVREALFDMLAPRLAGARFLDLFAGVGGVGLEAASRGAAQVVMVEVSPQHARVIAENAATLGLAGQVKVLRAAAAAALSALARQGAEFDIIFLDPPFSHPQAVTQTLGRLDERPELLAEGGVVVVQHASRVPAPETVGHLARQRTRRFGENALTFYARQQARQGAAPPQEEP